MVTTSQPQHGTGKEKGHQGTSETLGPKGESWRRTTVEYGSIYGFPEDVSYEMEAGQCWARCLLRRQEVITETHEETVLGLGGQGCSVAPARLAAEGGCKCRSSQPFFPWLGLQRQTGADRTATD